MLSTLDIIVFTACVSIILWEIFITALENSPCRKWADKGLAKMERNKKTFWIALENNGDGSGSPYLFTSKEKAEEFEETQCEGWGDSCVSSFDIVCDDGEIRVDGRVDPERDEDGYIKD